MWERCAMCEGLLNEATKVRHNDIWVCPPCWDKLNPHPEPAAETSVPAKAAGTIASLLGNLLGLAFAAVYIVGPSSVLFAAVAWLLGYGFWRPLGWLLLIEVGIGVVFVMVVFLALGVAPLMKKGRSNDQAPNA